MARKERAPRQRPVSNRPDHTVVVQPHLEDGEVIRAAASQVDTGPVHPYLLLLVPIVLYIAALLTGLTFLALLAGMGGLGALLYSRQRFTRYVSLTDRRLLFFGERLMRGPKRDITDQVRRRDLVLRTSKQGVLFHRFAFDVTGTADAGTEPDAGRSLSLRVPRVNQAFIQALDAKVSAPGTVRKPAAPDPSGRTTPKGGARRRR